MPSLFFERFVPDIAVQIASVKGVGKLKLDKTCGE
jgi:hypothetical protein